MLFSIKKSGLIKIFILIVYLVFFQIFQLFSQGSFSPKQLNDWDEILNFAISPDEDYMIVAIEHNGKEKLFESRIEDGKWSNPSPLHEINDYGGGNANIGGPSFNFDGSTLYFHANYNDAVGGYDLYYSKKKANEWSKPESLGETINSVEDEFYPSINASESKILFSRGNPDADVRKPRGTPGCQVFYASYKNFSDNKWEEPVLLHDAINKACEYGLYLDSDGRTVYFSSVDQDDYRDGYNIYFAQEMERGSWVKPILIENIASEETIVNPRVLGNNIYFLKRSEGWRGTEGIIYKAELKKEFLPLKTIVSKGKILDLENNEPINTSLTVFDPTTLEVLGIFDSDEQTGKYEIPLLDDQNYIVDIRHPGYSFASFQLDYRQDEKIKGPDSIKLFDKIELLISVYDSEIFRPIEADVWVEVLSDNNRRIDAQKSEPGLYALELPIGHNYDVKASASGFEDNGFEFNLFGDIVFSQFERNIPLEPIKKSFDVYITDSDTKEEIGAEITFKNLDRDEVITYTTIDEPEKDDTITSDITEETGIDKIDVSTPKDPNRFALIIGNEDYSSYQVGLDSESNVEFAVKDAKAFKQYAINVFGVPEDNILFTSNAAVVQMHNNIEKLINIIKILDGDAEIFFYFAGHGFPDEQSNEPYIMPVDVTGANLRFAVKLEELYERLTEYPAKRITMFFDACFSGGARNAGLVSARGVRVRPQEPPLDGNLIVFSASSERQSAHPYRDKEHGMFTYFLLKKLKETEGNITYKELSDYITEIVDLRSVMINNQRQTPQTNVSSTIKDSWQEWEFIE